MEIAYGRTGELVVENKHLSSETSRLTEALAESEERTQRLQEEADGLRHQQVRLCTGLHSIRADADW